jgi:plastocyanin
MSRAVVVALLGLVAALALGACTKQEPRFTANDQVFAEDRTASESASGGGGSGGSGDGGGATFAAQGLAFSDAPSQVSAGEVEITLDNEANVVHNVAFEGVNGGSPVVEAQGGESASETVELESGELTYFCSVPGHREAGMEGTLTAQ